MSFISKAFGANNDYNPQTPVNKFAASSPVQGGTLAQGNAQASGGAGPASGTINRQNMLSDQLQAAANGQGPSPAEQLLKKQTSQNINTAAGQAASIRGGNPALAMRTAVDSASTANQGAAADAATLKANEQIAARGQLGTNLAQTGSTQLGQQAAGTSLLGTAGGLDLGAQGINAGVASQNAGLQLGTEQMQAGIAGQNAATNAGIAGGVMNGIGAALSLAEGGEVPHPESLAAYLDQLHRPVQHFDEGGFTSGQFDPGDNVAGPGADAAGGAGAAGGAAAAGAGPAAPVMAAKDELSKKFHAVTSAIANSGPQGLAAGDRLSSMHLAGSIYAHGGPVPARVSPGEVVVPPTAAHHPAEAARYVSHGQNVVPGHAQVSGDSPQNDTVHARLQPGSVVIPRSITQGPNAAKKAASFVASVMKRSGEKRYAVGGKVAPGAATQAPAPVDLSGGGMVEHYRRASDNANEAGPGSKAPAATARGVGGATTRSRIRRSEGGKRKYSDNLARFPGE